jgi:glycosyltransferase involved in cell wall biosynthesis
MKAVQAMDPIENPAPLVSVIIPCFNAELYLLQAIQSVVNQTYTSWQLVIVDDGSTDATQSIISELSSKLGPKLVTIRTPNRGACSARNTGVAAAAGRYVAFLDSDDYWHSEKLKVQVEYLQGHPQLAGVGCQYSIVRNGNDESTGIVDFKWSMAATVDWLLLYGNAPALNSVLLMKREVFKDLSGFDTDLGSHAEDLDFLWRLMACSELGYLPHEYAAIRQWSGQGHLQFASMHASLVKVYEKLRISEPKLHSEAVVNLEIYIGLIALREMHFKVFVSTTMRQLFAHPKQTARFLGKLALR